MQLHISPSMRSITISSSGNNGFIDSMKIKVAARHISYRTLFHTILILAFLLPFVFILTAVVTLEGVNKCSSFDCLGRRLGPRLLGRVDDSGRLVKDFYKILNQVKNEEIPDGVKLPASFNHLVSEMKNNQYDARTFAFMLRAMMEKLEREIRESKFAELMNKHFAASSIPKSIHCLSLRLTDEYSSNAHARTQLPSPEFLPLLSDNSYHHFVLSTDNILAASVVVTSTVQSSLKPDRIVFHIITDKKTYAGMHSWFALNPASPATVEVKGVHQFDWLTRENVPVLEAVENHNGIRDYYHGNHIAGTNLSDTTPRRFASKLQARSPKYISLLNHLRIYIPEMLKDKKKASENNSNSRGIVVDGLIHLLRGRNSPDLTGNYSSSPAKQSQNLTLDSDNASKIFTNTFILLYLLSYVNINQTFNFTMDLNFDQYRTQQILIFCLGLLEKASRKSYRREQSFRSEFTVMPRTFAENGCITSTGMGFFLSIFNIATHHFFSWLKNGYYQWASCRESI
ncbi:galacturonosyltransferase 14 isoform X2 [Populus alba x Populus x berolinensis]|uniref:Hexosyltransferase n=1 Tax=Populus alba x Populus x berolinensis TaxID=444605 RepID=A0AAD6R1W3_9ROSI|nr:galacturonosyltransferase 14 isoform X2 [Populus alba x Populus x berolinensis]